MTEALKTETLKTETLKTEALKETKERPDPWPLEYHSGTVTPEILGYLEELKGSDGRFVVTPKDVKTYGVSFLATVYDVIILGPRTAEGGLPPRLPPVLEESLLELEGAVILWNYVFARKETFRETPWRNAEEKFLLYPAMAANYAYEVMQKRWPEFEALLGDPARWSPVYKKAALTWKTIYENAWTVAASDK